jgi:hypothetical protein
MMAVCGYDNRDSKGLRRKMVEVQEVDVEVVVPSGVEQKLTLQISRLGFKKFTLSRIHCTSIHFRPP